MAPSFNAKGHLDRGLLDYGRKLDYMEGYHFTWNVDCNIKILFLVSIEIILLKYLILEITQKKRLIRQ